MAIGENGSTQKARITVRIVENGYIVEYLQGPGLKWEYVCEGSNDVVEKIREFLGLED